MIRLCIASFFVASLLASGSSRDESGASSRRPQELSYRHEQIPKGPWSTHVVIIDRSNRNLELQTTLPKGRRFGLATLSEQIKAFPSDGCRVIAGINGDYYERHGPYLGDPQGLQIIQGELVSAPFDWACFWVDANGKPNIGKVDSQFNVVLPTGEKILIGLNEERADDEAVIYTPAVGSTTHTRGGTDFVLEPKSKGPQLPLRANERYFARVTEIQRNGNSSVVSNRLVLSIGPKLLSKIKIPEVGDTVRIATATSAASLKNAPTAIGGGPILVQHARPAFPKTTPIRHPRSALGWNKDSYFLVEVDGRNPDLSVGMTFEELANYMIKLGCSEAIGLDGGGSATLWTMGQVMNDPCEGGERGTGNSLVVISRAKN
jgi:large repetitive protein